MDRAIVTWSNGLWDIGDLRNMGRDAIPTLYDANASGYYDSEYQSGIGYGNQLYLRSISEEDVRDLYPTSSLPSGTRWSPVLEHGYFYIGQDEYFLFADKDTVVGTPTLGKLELGLYNDKYPMNSPIVVTSGVSEFLATDPFAKTYEPTPSGIDDRTPTKYRKVTDLTGRKEYSVDSSGHLITYQFNWSDYTFTVGASGNNTLIPSGWYRYINLYPSGFSVTVESESSPSGWNSIREVDLNPYNSYENHDTFLVIAQSGSLLPYLSKYSLDLDYVNRTTAHAATTRLDFIATVKDKWGAPVSGSLVSWTDDAAGSFSNTVTTTIWDGTTYGKYIPSGSATSAGITITATAGPATDSLWIPLGKV